MNKDSVVTFTFINVYHPREPRGIVLRDHVEKYKGFHEMGDAEIFGHQRAAQLSAEFSVVATIPSADGVSFGRGRLPEFCVSACAIDCGRKGPMTALPAPPEATIIPGTRVEILGEGGLVGTVKRLRTGPEHGGDLFTVETDAGNLWVLRRFEIDKEKTK